MNRKNHPGRILLLAMAVIFTMLPVRAQEPQSMDARTLAIQSLSGAKATVNKGGRKELKAAAGMKLSAGSTVKTGAGTTLYIQADEDKFVKLAENSSVTISQASASKLRIAVDAGEIFFNVEKPVPEGEELLFTAGNISMSVRGTAGVIVMAPASKGGGGDKTGSAQVTLGVFHGQVEMSSAVTGQAQMIGGGEMGRGRADGQPLSAGGSVRKEGLSLAGMSVSTVSAAQQADIAIEMLVAETKGAADAKAELLKLVEQKSALEKKTAFAPSGGGIRIPRESESVSSGGGSGGSGGGSSSTPSASPEPTVPPEPTVTPAPTDAPEGDSVTLDISRGDILLTNSGYRANGEEAQVPWTGGYILTGRSDSYTVAVSGYDIPVTIQDLSITAPDGKNAIELRERTNLRLSGQNYLEAGSHYSGLRVNREVVISGSGKLKAKSSGAGSAIGGYIDLTAGSIHLIGGEIEAEAENSYAIGGPRFSVNISGGAKVEAVATGEQSIAICGNAINISGGKVEAKHASGAGSSTVAKAAAMGSEHGTVAISGGEVKITAKEAADGIIGGRITISGGEVKVNTEHGKGFTTQPSISGGSLEVTENGVELDRIEDLYLVKMSREEWKTTEEKLLKGGYGAYCNRASIDGGTVYLWLPGEIYSLLEEDGAASSPPEEPETQED